MVTVTIDEVRTMSGADGTNASLITDDRIQDIIDIVNPKAFNHFDFKEIPTNTMEFYRGYDLNDIKVNKQKIMSLTAIYVNEQERELDSFTFNENLGKIQTRKEYDRTNWCLFPKTQPYRVKIKYSYAMLKPSGTATETTASIVAGSSIDIAVDDESEFSVNDYVRIQGFDGNNEVAKITATDTDEITVDTLVLSHDSGSIIELLEVPKILKDYILYDCCYNVANYIVGNTSNLPTSWSQEGESATVGVAYTHWQSSRDSFKTQRDELSKDVWALKSTIL